MRTYSSGLRAAGHTTVFCPGASAHSLAGRAIAATPPLITEREVPPPAPRISCSPPKRGSARKQLTSRA